MPRPWGGTLRPMADIGLIGAPTSAGAYAPGQELAPQRLREARLP